MRKGALNTDMPVGGGVKWRFHNLELGDHIENAYHIMALNEHRFYFDVTLWESDRARDPNSFEQCWIAGDHSNVGGSWDDQQIADITLAWMMGRFWRLGAQFDWTYLYGEFLKYKDYVQNLAPYLPYDADQNNPYSKELYPRTYGQGKPSNPVKVSCLWYLGRIHNEFYNTGFALKKTLCGSLSSFSRTPGQYKKPIWTGSTTTNDVVAYTGGYLTNTNETMHRIIKYRKECDKRDKMGHHELERYDPSSLSGPNWKWPSGTNNKYTVTREDKSTKEFDISQMTSLEYMYLAFYALDPYFSTKKDGTPDNLWKALFGWE